MAFRTGILHIAEINESTISTLVTALRRQNFPMILIQEAAVGNQRNWIEEMLRRWSDEEELDLILTVGGTMPAPGPSQLECVPEATAAVLERRLPGLSEKMRLDASLQTPLALLDRGVCGIRGRTLIVNLPKGTAAALLFLEAVISLIAPTLAYLQGDAAPPEIEDDLELTADDMIDESEYDEVQHVKSHGLDADEFARFLQRKGSK